MGIIMSALAAAGDEGVKSMGQNLKQMDAMDLESQRSQLEQNKQLAILSAQKQAQIDTANQLRQGQSDRISAAQGGVVQDQMAQKYAGSDAAVQAAASGQTDAPLTPDQLAVINSAKSADLTKFAADPHTYIAAAMKTGDIDPHQVAQLAQQEDAIRRQEAAQKLQFEHSDKSQREQFAHSEALARQSQAHADAMQARLLGSREDENQKNRDLQMKKMLPPADITSEEKKNWVHTYITNNGSVPRSAPNYVRNSIGTWAAQAGITPDDIMKGTAQQKFDQSAAVTSGHRAGAMASVEATMPALADNALSLAKDLGQGNFVPINKMMQMAEGSISDPKLAAFKVGHMALVSEYQQVISRGGTNVTALNEAMRVLNNAVGWDAYSAAVNQVKKEVAINVGGTNTVRANLGGSHTTPAGPSMVANPVAPTGMPDDIAALMNKYGK
jgi:hypothetical protein